MSTQEVDAVREQRHRADRQRHSELDAKVGKVQNRREADGAAYPSFNRARCGGFHTLPSSLILR
jgi:hypothetical protein